MADTDVLIVPNLLILDYATRVHAEIVLVRRDIWEVFEQRTKPARQYLGRESGYTKV